ncbi:MAG: 30S ribosomal protein S8 [bacterium]|nr:30S ribosomal protein S8 [bacterium]
MTDPIADMLTRIRNANSAGHEKVEVPSSKVKLEIARILKSEGFIKNYKLVKNRKQGVIKIYLKYGPDKQRAIRGIERVSTPGIRRYAGYDRIPKVLSGLGVLIVSTSKGILTDKEARQLKVGGELLCKVW